MRTRGRTFALALMASSILAINITTATAAHLRASSALAIIRWAPLRFIAGSNTASCNVTLEGSFHSATIAKVNEALIGNISRASVNSCTGGSATALAETLPWHVRYSGFTGTLPNITGVKLRIISDSFRVQPSGSTVCLARSTVANPIIGIVTENPTTHSITGMTAEPNAAIPLEGFLCEFAGEGRFEGTGSVENGARGTITVTLI